MSGLLLVATGCEQSKPLVENNDRGDQAVPAQSGDDNPIVADNQTENEESNEPRVIDPKAFDYTVLPSIELIDVTGGDATGIAYYGFVEGLGTRHKVVASNMPELEEGYFYEGWLVRGDQFFSTGEMKKEGDNYVLYWVNHLNDTPFRFVVITLEPDDGNDLPAAHIIEAAFPDDQNLNVVL